METEKIKKEPMKIFPVYLSDEMKASAMQQAKDEKKSLASIIRGLIAGWVNK